MYYSVESIINELITIHSSIKDLEEHEILHSPSGYLKAFFQRLDFIAALDIDDQLIQQIVCRPEYKTAFESIVKFRNLYSLRLEIERVNSVLTSSDPWKVLRKFTHFANYSQLATTEFQGSSLKQGDCVVFLGSGPLPLSLIMLCHQHGIQGVGIEQEPDRARLSREVLSKLGLSGQIEIIDGNHFLLPLGGKCDLLMVAAAAEPKTEVFGHLADTVPGGTAISYRIYEKGLRKIMDVGSLWKLPDSFEESLRIRPKPPVNNTVVFLTQTVS